MFRENQKNNLKLVGLDNQMVEMDKDFEDMLKAREIARKKLEQKFKDVYSRITDNKNFMISSGKEFNQKLQKYQNQFNTDLEDDRNQLNAYLTSEQNIGKTFFRFLRIYRISFFINLFFFKFSSKLLSLVNDVLTKTDQRMLDLENAIADEKKDRKETWDRELKELDDHFNSIKQGFSDETKNRIQKKRNVIQAMEEGNNKVNFSLLSKSLLRTPL